MPDLPTLADDWADWVGNVGGCATRHRDGIHSRFSESELPALMDMAHHRNDAKVAAGLDRMAANSDPLFINYCGLKGELAWARLCGKTVTQLPDLYRGDGGARDLVIGDHSYQVKHTEHRHGFFCFPHQGELKAEFGVLVVGGKGEDRYYRKASESCYILGFCTQEIWKAREAPHFDKSALGIHQRLLLPLSEIPGIQKQLTLFGG